MVVCPSAFLSPLYLLTDSVDASLLSFNVFIFLWAENQASYDSL